MPRIPRDWLDAIVYLYPTEDDAHNGTRLGATGFMVTVPPDDPDLPLGLAHYYLVTNAHCVERFESVAVRINAQAGGFEVLSIAREHWITHPNGDDVAATYLDIGHRPFRYIGVNQAMILTPDLQGRWEYGPGDEVFFMGRYVDIDGKEHNEPVLRSGMLSGFPSEPIHQRERNHYQETILAEARSLSGFSGSPVFVWSPHHLERQADGVPLANVILSAPCFLLGIDWGHHPWHEPVRDGANTEKPIGDMFVRGNSGMMMMVPAWKLPELLEVDDLIAPRRDKEAREWELRKNSPSVLDNAETESDEFGRFEDLTRKLVQTPKPKTGE